MKWQLLTILLLTFAIWSFQLQNLSKKNNIGRKVHFDLKQRGSGITPQQQQTVLSIINEATVEKGQNPPQNAEYINNKVQEVLGGVWNVYIVPQPANWGANWSAYQDKYIFYYAHPPFKWTISVWKSRN